MGKTYYIEMMGVYGQGVFWIGSDHDMGIARAIELASEDTDSYHDWVLRLYKGEGQDDEEIYRVKKPQANHSARKAPQ